MKVSVWRFFGSTFSHVSTDERGAKENQHMIDVSTIGLAAVGWFVTTWMSYRWGICAERRRNKEAADNAVRSRRRDFLAFITKWEAEFSGLNFSGGGRGEHYQKTQPGFLAEARRIEDDFTEPKRRETFKTLVSRAAGFTPAAVDNYHADKGKKDLLEAIDAIKEFMDT